MKRPYVIINIRLRNGSHSKCQATKLPLKIKSLHSAKGRLKGGMEKSQIQRTLQIKWSLLLTKHILLKHTSCFSAGAALDKMWVSFEKDIISNEFWKCHTEYWSIESCRQRDRGQQRALPVIQFSELADTSSPRQMASAHGRGREAEGRLVGEVESVPCSARLSIVCNEPQAWHLSGFCVTSNVGLFLSQK